MAYFKIDEPGHPTKYIKSIDRANGTLEFSEDREGCFQQDSGFFADSEFAYLKFHFTEAYPELQYMSIDTGYHYHRHTQMGMEEPINVLQGAPIEQDAPNDPFGGEIDVAFVPFGVNEAEAVVEGPQAPQVIENRQQFNDIFNNDIVRQAIGLHADDHELVGATPAAQNNAQADLPWQ